MCREETVLMVYSTFSSLTDRMYSINLNAKPINANTLVIEA